MLSCEQYAFKLSRSIANNMEELCTRQSPLRNWRATSSFPSRNVRPSEALTLCLRSEWLRKARHTWRETTSWRQPRMSLHLSQQHHFDQHHVRCFWCRLASIGLTSRIMAPTKKKPARAASASQSDEASQQPSQEMLQIDGDKLAEIARMQNAKACFPMKYCYLCSC